MKRRSFLKGLAASLIAPKILLTKKVEAVVPTPPRVVRKGMPDIKWRKLYEGVPITATEVSKAQEQLNRDIAELLNEPNPILDDIMWKVSNGRT